MDYKSEYSGGFIPYSRVEHLKYLVADGEAGFVTTSNRGPGCLRMFSPKPGTARTCSPWTRLKITSR